MKSNQIPLNQVQSFGMSILNAANAACVFVEYVEAPNILSIVLSS